MDTLAAWLLTPCGAPEVIEPERRSLVDVVDLGARVSTSRRGSARGPPRVAGVEARGSSEPREVRGPHAAAMELGGEVRHGAQLGMPGSEPGRLSPTARRTPPAPRRSRELHPANSSRSVPLRRRRRWPCERLEPPAAERRHQLLGASDAASKRVRSPDVADDVRVAAADAAIAVALRFASERSFSPARLPPSGFRRCSRRAPDRARRSGRRADVRAAGVAGHREGAAALASRSTSAREVHAREVEGGQQMSFTRTQHVTVVRLHLDRLQDRSPNSS